MMMYFYIRITNKHIFSFKSHGVRKRNHADVRNSNDKYKHLSYNSNKNINTDCLNSSEHSLCTILKRKLVGHLTSLKEEQTRIQFRTTYSSHYDLQTLLRLFALTFITISLFLL
jgi:hypothetical protein